MIAGCINQSKRIFEKFDRVLYGQLPENLIKKTHASIRDLLISEEGTKFLKANSGELPVVEESGEILIKKIIEAVYLGVPHHSYHAAEQGFRWVIYEDCATTFRGGRADVFKV